MKYASGEWGRESKERDIKKGKRKGKGGGDGHRAGDGHGLLKVSIGPTMPYPSMPCGRPPLKQPHGRFRGGHPLGEQPAAVLLSL
jgi:hypothetical protein